MPSRTSKAARAAELYPGLLKLYPDAHCELDYRNAYELLVATILSAQCTDVRVNMVTPALFAHYPGPADMAKAELVDVEELVRSTGFYRNKAKALIALGRALAERHESEVPDNMEALVELPGVGRKTANVVLGTWFDQPAIFVDTHVARRSKRLGWTAHKDPVKIERDLQGIFPRAEWTFTSHALIWHGRRVCTARKPACEACSIRRDCPFPA